MFSYACEQGDVIGCPGRMRLAIPNRSAYMRAHGMYVVAHSFQPTACVFARIDYICVNHVCVCVCIRERGDHTHRAQVLRGLQPYLKHITTRHKHAL